MNWLERHDPITIYLDEKADTKTLEAVKTACEKYIRSSEDVLLGKKFASGMALQKSPDEQDIKAILQEAIQGKLTESWRKTATIEESGKQLLDKIIEERNAKLLADWEEAKKKNPKAKKPAQIVASEITEDEIPFEIPKSWCWCRLGELGLYRKGPFGSSLTKSMFVPRSEFSVKVYEQKNAIQKDFTLGDYYIPKEKFNSMQSFNVEPEDIIISCAGTIGEVYKLPKNAPIGIINQALMRV